MTTTTGAAATKPRATKTTAKATDTTAGASPMAPEPMARWHGEAMLTGLRKPLYAYVGAGDLALEKLREIPTEWSEITAALSDEAAKVQEAMSAEMARLQEHLSVEKLQATQTVEQLRELPEQATELRSQLQDHAMALSDRAGDLYTDLVARGERVVESRR
jgi:hypothetical protein